MLQQGYDVIMLDARGHGLSASPPEGYRLDDFAADLAGVIQVLNMTGHNIRRDQFERYIRAVQQFLDKNYVHRFIL